jgi:hypothetical protein
MCVWEFQAWNMESIPDNVEGFFEMKGSLNAFCFLNVIVVKIVYR